MMPGSMVDTVGFWPDGYGVYGNCESERFLCPVVSMKEEWMLKDRSRKVLATPF